MTVTALPHSLPSLVADVGGTNTRVALAVQGRILPETVRRFANAEASSLEEVLARYRREESIGTLAGACVAVAGPVRDGVGELTNLAWSFGGPSLAQATGAPEVAVLNDLQAQGHALGYLPASAHRVIVQGKRAPRPFEAQLVVGVGTGLNAAPVIDSPEAEETAGTPRRGARVVAASECGHVTLPVRSEADLRLSRHISKLHGFPDVEEVLSGRGIGQVDAWLAAEAGETDTRDAKAILAALESEEPRAIRATETFVQILGAFVGDLALVHLPYGGLHLIGGMARAVTPWLGRFDFAEAFRDKGRFAPLMGDFTVTVIEDDYAALTGCARHLADRLARATA